MAKAAKQTRRSRGAADTPGVTSPVETLVEAARRLEGLLGPELAALLDAPAAGPGREGPVRGEVAAEVFVRNRERLALLHALVQRAHAAYTALLAGLAGQVEAHVPDEDLERAGKQLLRETAVLFGLSSRRSETLLDLGESRARFPQLHQAHSRGLLGVRHVEAFLRGTADTPLSEEQERQLDAELAPLAVAQRWTSHRIERETRALAEELTATDTAERLRCAAAARAVTIYDVGAGMSVLKVFAPSPVLHAVYRRLTRLAGEHVQQDRNTREQARTDKENQDQDQELGQGRGQRRGSGSTGSATLPVLRTMDQARADVHTEILLAADPLQAALSPDRVQARISLTIPALSLTGEAGQLARTDPGEPGEPSELSKRARPAGPVGGAAEMPVSGLVAAAMAGLPAEVRHAVRVNAAGHATLDGVGAIDPATALALLPCSPEIQRIFTHPITGSVLAVDRYTTGPALRRFLNARDGHCRYPGCRRQAEACDADHTIPYRKGGATANGNLALLCRHHHRAKHSPGYQLRQSEDGELEWITPAGQRLVDLPERTYLPGTLRRRVVFEPSPTRPGTVDPQVVIEPETHGQGWTRGVPNEPNWRDPATLTTYLHTHDPLGNRKPEHTPKPPPGPDPKPKPDPDPWDDEPPF